MADIVPYFLVFQCCWLEAWGQSAAYFLIGNLWFSFSSWSFKKFLLVHVILKFYHSVTRGVCVCVCMCLKTVLVDIQHTISVWVFMSLVLEEFSNLFRWLFVLVAPPFIPLNLPAILSICLFFCAALWEDWLPRSFALQLFLQLPNFSLHST